MQCCLGSRMDLELLGQSVPRDLDLLGHSVPCNSHALVVQIDRQTDTFMLWVLQHGFIQAKTCTVSVTYRARSTTFLTSFF
jgi:hypothetical protein